MISPARPSELRQQLLHAVGAVDEGEAALGPHHGEGEPDPGSKIGFALDRRGGLAGIGRGGRRRRLEEGRVRHDMGEAAGLEPRRWPQQVAGHDDDPAREIIEHHVLAGQPEQVPLRLDAGDAAALDARRQAQRGRADAAADVEHAVAGACRHRGGEQHRIDRHAIAGERLTQLDAPVQQRVIAHRQVRGWIGHPGVSPASASAASARR